MLVLSRKTSQRIYLGDSIVLTIVDIGGDRVKVGIEAPQGIEIWRSEIAAKKAQEKNPDHPELGARSA